jgi:hypothetical protein
MLTSITELIATRHKPQALDQTEACGFICRTQSFVNRTKKPDFHHRNSQDLRLMICLQVPINTPELFMLEDHGARSEQIIRQVKDLRILIGTT